METINNNPYQRNHVLKSRIITRNLAVLIFFIVAITAKIFLLLLLPDKYLYDSNHIIDICNGANDTVIKHLNLVLIFLSL